MQDLTCPMLSHSNRSKTTSWKLEISLPYSLLMSSTLKEISCHPLHIRKTKRLLRVIYYLTQWTSYIEVTFYCEKNFRIYVQQPIKKSCSVTSGSRRTTGLLSILLLSTKIRWLVKTLSPVSPVISNPKHWQMSPCQQDIFTPCQQDTFSAVEEAKAASSRV